MKWTFCAKIAIIPLTGINRLRLSFGIVTLKVVVNVITLSVNKLLMQVEKILKSNMRMIHTDGIEELTWH